MSSGLCTFLPIVSGVFGALAYPVLLSPRLNISFTIPNSIALKSTFASLLSVISL